MTPLILALDQGTTSSRAIVFDTEGTVKAVAQKEVPLITPQNGWVEQDPRQIIKDVYALIQSVVTAQPDMRPHIAALGITNQRETIVVWDRDTGDPLYNAIVWQDRRTSALCADLKTKGHERDIQARTGLLCDPYFSATKLAWLRRHINIDESRILAGTMDTWVIWHLTGGAVHATDPSNASRTSLFNITTQDWDDDLCALFGVPRNWLPEVRDSADNFGYTDAARCGISLPIRAVLGDQQAALFGQGCHQPGMVKATYGTGCFALMNTGDTRPYSQNRLLGTVAWRVQGQTTYALEGSIFVAGAAVQFMRDVLGLIDEAADSETLARSVTDSDGVMFVPALAGLGAPYWEPQAKGALFGLTRGTTPAHILRATLDAQAFQTQDLLEAMRADTGQGIDRLRVDGGLVRNTLVCDLIAQHTGVIVERPMNTEATAWGAAAMAGLSVGIFPSISDISTKWRAEAQFTATITPQTEDAYARWKQAVLRLIPPF